MNCLIYPYSDLLFPLVSHLSDFQSEHSIKAVVYPKAWKLKIRHPFSDSSICMTHDFASVLEQAEGVILADVSEMPYMYRDILKKAGASLAAGKTVFCCTKLEEADLQKLRSDYPDAEIHMLYQNTEQFHPVEFERHEQCNAVTIGVGALYRGLDSFASLTFLTHEFRRLGYRVTAVSCNETGRMLGFAPYPKQLLAAEPELEHRPEILNNYFVSLERFLPCDIMLIQFPDGLMKYANYAADAYGIHDFILTRAIGFDCFVLTSCLELGSEAYAILSDGLKQRFQLSLDACVLQDVLVDSVLTLETRTMSYTQNGIEKYADFAERLNEKYCDTHDIFFTDQFTESGYREIAAKCIRKLS